MRNITLCLIVPLAVACGTAQPAPDNLVMPCSEARDCEAFGAEFAGYRCAGATDRAKGLCVPDNCGDGVLDVGEECDDANDDSTDECTANCEEARCGDSIVHDGVEECDDGNEDDADSTCTNACTTPACGDGIQQVDLGEACDDGNVSDGDDCSSDCQLATCGDGIIQGLEECDDGNAVETDACINCLEARCGDAFVHEGNEECDDGNEVDTDDCTSDCLNPACGDGFNQPGHGEACDDGNDDNGDECTDLCRLATCGDGEVQAGEECDDGNDIDTDSCANCAEAQCGDGLVQLGVEECDDGNRVDTDTCTNACSSPVCGDGVIQVALDEDCDDGNRIDTDVCRNTCTLAACGDGVLHEGVEACDDGNDVATDACTDCQDARCGDGVLRADLAPGDEGHEYCDGQDYCSDSCVYRPRQLAAGMFTTCGLRDGEVYCWGQGGSGELGLGEVQTALVPTRLQGLEGASELSAGYGYKTCTLTQADDRLYCWGRTLPLGGATLENRQTPSSLGTGFTAAAASSAGVFGLKNGYIYAGGNPVFYSLGNGGNQCTRDSDCGRNGDCPNALAGGPRYCIPSSAVTSISGNRVRSGYSPRGGATYLSGVRAVSAGGNHACAITSNQRVRCWGRNYDGQGGIGTSGHDTDIPYASTDASYIAFRPLRYQALTNVVDLAPAFAHCGKHAVGNLNRRRLDWIFCITDI